MLRRLNRQEYENALRDLLGVPWAQIANRLPEDGEAYRFNKSGEALDISYLQMARFMDCGQLRHAAGDGDGPGAAGEDALASYMHETSRACAIGGHAKTEPCPTGCPFRFSMHTPSRMFARAVLRRAARKPGNAKPSAECRAFSATQAAIAGTAGVRRSRRVTS